MNVKGVHLATVMFFSSLMVCLLSKFMVSLQIVRKALPFISFQTAGFLLCVQLLDMNYHMILGYDGHKHDHAGEDRHLSENSSMAGLFFSGLSFIFLLAIDSIVLKHKHCDEGRDAESCINEDDDCKNDSHKRMENNIVMKETKAPEKEATEASIYEEKEIKESLKNLGCCSAKIVENTSSRMKIIIYALGMLIHSFFEGLAFKSAGRVGSMDIGLIIHKILESFTFGVALFSSGFRSLKSFVFAVLYSCLTPMGILIGTNFGNINNTTICIFNGIASGSMMFIVFVEMIPQVFDHQKGNPQHKIILLLSGYLIGAVLIYFSHQH